MVYCRMGEHQETEGWNSKGCDLEILGAAPKTPLDFDPPSWNERRIESSLLKNPSALVRGLGIRGARRILALRQVDEVDLFLRANERVHLIEVKGLRGIGRSPYRQWRFALGQIAAYWSSRRAWLTPGIEPVFLWALCPIRWDVDGAEIPSGWRAAVADIQVNQLQGAKRNSRSGFSRDPKTRQHCQQVHGGRMGSRELMTQHPLDGASRVHAPRRVNAGLQQPHFLKQLETLLGGADADRRGPFQRIDNRMASAAVGLGFTQGWHGLAGAASEGARVEKLQPAVVFLLHLQRLENARREVRRRSSGDPMRLGKDSQRLGTPSKVHF